MPDAQGGGAFVWVRHRQDMAEIEWMAARGYTRNPAYYGTILQSQIELSFTPDWWLDPTVWPTR